MAAKPNFVGAGVALVTPFRKSGQVDFNALSELVENQIANGVDYLVALGTTSEAPTLSVQEAHAVLETILDVVDKRIPVVVGIGGYSTQAVIEKMAAAPLERASGILSVVPFYNKPSQEGIFRHFQRVAECSSLPLIIYNVPGRTSCNMEAETVLRLAEIGNIVAVKEASGNLTQCMEILRHKPEKFHLISGDDLMTLPILAMGGSGVISVIGNAFPAEMSKLVKAGLSGNLKEARKIHYQLQELVQLIFKEGSPAGIKAVLEHMDICQNTLRLPLTKVSSKMNSQIASSVDQILK